MSHSTDTGWAQDADRAGWSRRMPGYGAIAYPMPDGTWTWAIRSHSPPYRYQTGRDLPGAVSAMEAADLALAAMRGLNGV